MYVSVQDDDKIAIFTMDANTGKLTPKMEAPVPGGPSPLAISPDRTVLYVGHGGSLDLSSFRIDQDTGGLTQNGTVSLEAAPEFLATDRKGRFVLSAYYYGGIAAVHPIGDDGTVGGPAIEWVETAKGSHAMQTDRSNRFAFVPHIADVGPNAIFQYRFDENTGHITPNSPPRVDLEEYLGPRHFCFHPTKDILYFSDEQGNSVTGYHLDTSKGTLSAFQTITTLPEGYTGANTCSQIQMTPSGDFLYVPNRGHDSIAGFSVDPSSGRLTGIGQVSTEAAPHAFSLDPEGKFVFAAGGDSGRLASYRINGDTGELTPLETYSVGQSPMWVLMTTLGD
jgi:6-phosphogluconolactonase